MAGWNHRHGHRGWHRRQTFPLPARDVRTSDLAFVELRQHLGAEEPTAWSGAPTASPAEALQEDDEAGLCLPMAPGRRLLRNQRTRDELVAIRFGQGDELRQRRGFARPILRRGAHVGSLRLPRIQGQALAIRRRCSRLARPFVGDSRPIRRRRRRWHRDGRLRIAFAPGD